MPAYKLPNGDVTDDQNLYTLVWRQLGTLMETLVPGMRLTGFDPEHNGGTLKFHIGQTTLLLPPWFIQRLADNTRTATGKKLHALKVRAQKCETCEVKVHTVGRGRTRRFCSDCLVLRTKLGKVSHD